MAGKVIQIAGRSWRQLAVACVLLVLVAGLAVLQYRWVGQIAEGERQRMQASVQARAGQFAEELNREATALFAAFSQLARMADANADVDYPKLFADEYARWVAASAHARLVRALFLIEEDEGGSTRVRKLTDGAFEPTQAPEILNAVRARFHDTAGDRVRVLTLQFDGQIPALLIPVARLRVTELAAPSRHLRIMNFTGVSGCLVVQLDRDYLRREWLPALARRYFDSSQGFDYNLAVVDSVAHSFVYASDSRLAMAVFAKPDAKVPLFQVRADQVNRLYVGRAVGKAARPGQSVQMNISTLQDHATVPPAATAPQWHLLLTHRAGSLEAAIAQSRRRNLAISFGILALLAASLGLVVLSSRRAAYLARQQVEFVAGVSHELRTPLSVICSAAENLADGVVADGGQVRRYGQLIAAEGRRLAGMVEQVMTFAGLDADRGLAERETMNVEEVIEKALEASAPAIEQGGVAIERHIAPNLPPVRVNAAALRRALQNLIDNAVKYGGDSKWIGVTAALAEGSRRVAITVEDRGLGVPADEQRRLFEPFFRGREVATSPIHGSGLGLSLVKRIVDVHGGAVTVRSTPGRGSAFTIHLPAAERSRQASSSVGAHESVG